jgi:hypothetical protein
MLAINFLVVSRQQLQRNESQVEEIFRADNTALMQFRAYFIASYTSDLVQSTTARSLAETLQNLLRKHAPVICALEHLKHTVAANKGEASLASALD